MNVKSEHHFLLQLSHPWVRNLMEYLLTEFYKLFSADKTFGAHS